MNQDILIHAQLAASPAIVEAAPSDQRHTTQPIELAHCPYANHTEHHVTATTPVSIKRTPPGPAALPLLGGREALVPFFRDPLAFLTRLHRKYGSIVAFTRQHPSWLTVCGADANQQLLSQPDHFQIALFPFTAAPGTALQRITSGLAFMNGTIHKRHRQLLQPAFRRQQVVSHTDNVVALAQHMLDGWQLGQQRDICRDMHDLAIQMGTRMFLGIQSHTDATTLGVGVYRWLGRASSLPTALVPINLPGTPFHALHDVSDHLEARYRAIIADTRAASCAHADVVGTLIEARDSDGTALTDDELIGHLHTIALAGSETSANALTWTLFLLAQHPQILADLRDEIDGLLHGSVPAADDLERLPLLERVVKESLRILPPGAYLMRQSAAEATLGAFSIPAHARIIYSPYVTHHLPELYAEPERFWPDRWLGSAPPPYAYLPFGAGVHACIGNIFVMLTLRLTLTLILQRFSLHVAPGARIDRHVQLALSPKYGMPMIIQSRDAELIHTSVQGNIHEMVDLV